MLKAMTLLPISAVNCYDIIFGTLYGSTLCSMTGAQQCWPTLILATALREASCRANSEE